MEYLENLEIKTDHTRAYVNPRENSYKLHTLRKCTSLATFLSLIVKAHVHSVTHGQLRMPQHTDVKLAARKVHLKLNWTLRVIQGHPYWCRHAEIHNWELS